MGKRSLVPDAVEHYVSDAITKETPLQRRLRGDGEAAGGADADRPRPGGADGVPDPADRARWALEIGVFTGYSSLAVASALPDDGQLIACDVSEEWTRIARRYWDEAGVAGKIELRLGPALDTLAALRRDGADESFDFAFIDADKENNDAYYEACLRLVRPGGLIAVDNTIWGGRVADPAVHDAETTAIRALNLKMRDDARVEAVLLTVGDGVMLARKRPVVA